MKREQAALMAQESGGTLFEVHLTKGEPTNGGCGASTHVEGTNGGTMPCGAILHRFGKEEPYYCGLCRKN